MARNKAVAKSRPTDLVAGEVPDYIKQGSARGSENVTTEDLVIPRLEIVQALSPCIDESDAAYIEGAKPGMLFNSVTRELYGDSVIFIPVLFKQQYLLWRDRKKGGGFAGAYDSEIEAKAAIKEQNDPDNWEALKTAQHFGLLVEGDSWKMDEAVISMARTKLKISRNFNSLVRINGGDRFSRAYVVSAVQEQNNEGQKYYNFSIKNFGWAPQQVYTAAEKMYEAVASGERTIVADTSADDEVAESAEF